MGFKKVTSEIPFQKYGRKRSTDERARVVFSGQDATTTDMDELTWRGQQERPGREGCNPIQRVLSYLSRTAGSNKKNASSRLFPLQTYFTVDPI